MSDNEEVNPAFLMKSDAPAAQAAGLESAKQSIPITQRAELPNTVSEIIEWVGKDLDKAQTALDAENEKSEPRTTLVSHLEGLLAASE